MSININTVINVVCALGCAAGVAFGLKKADEASKATAKANEAIQKAAYDIGCSVEEVANKHVNVQESLVEAAVQRAADKAIQNAMPTIVDKTTARIAKDVEAKVRTIIDDSYGDYRKTVDNAVSVAIRNFDIDNYKDDIIEECTKTANKKLEHDLGVILKSYESAVNATKAIITPTGMHDIPTNAGTIRIITG